MKSSVIEVEEKFPLRNTSSLERRLKDLGFSPEDSIEMTDWYFDLSSYDLVRMDCWLRYRATKNKGQWQLKIGKRDHEGASTVYEEVEGSDAVQMACDLATPASSSGQTTIVAEEFSYDGHDVPDFPDSDVEFKPFARIYTQRTSWRHPSEAVTVDLDTTDFGYAVGEVEAVVKHNSEIGKARRQIKDLIKKLKDEPSEEEETLAPATGKLEYYIEQKRPALYAICVSSGVLRDPTKTETS